MGALRKSARYTGLLLTIAATLTWASILVADSTEMVSESEWLQKLKWAHLDNGQSLPMDEWINERSVSINNDDYYRWLLDKESETDGSDYEFSKLRYQADVSVTEFRLQLFYRF